MITTARATRRLAALVLALTTGLTLAGCGSDSATPTAHPSTSRTSTPTAAATPTASGTATDRATPSRSSSHTPGFRVVRVPKYGISFELPRGWKTLDAKNVLKGPNPALKEFASRMGMTVDQFVKTFASTVQTFSITDQGAVDGFLDNVNSVGIEGVEINDDRLKLEFATVKAKTGRFEHATSPAGDVIRVPYTLTTLGRVVHAVALVVVIDDETAVTISVSSHSAAAAAKRADQIQASLKSITVPPDV